MCGIVGFSGHVREGQWNQTHELLEALFLASQHRGRHATGFVAVTHPYKDTLSQQILVAKEPVPASQFLQQNRVWRGLRHRRCSMVLGHVRQATHGDPQNNQTNHPFVDKHGQYYLVHNGIITNHLDIARRFGLRLQTDCDTEVLIRLLEQSKHPAEALQTALHWVEGSVVVVVYDSHRDCIWMARDHGRSLWLCRLRDGRWFFSSEQEIMMNSMKQHLGKDAINQIEILFPLPIGHVAALTANGLLIALTGNDE